MDQHISHCLDYPSQPLQDLARPGVVERYVDSPQEAALLRTFFAGQWGLDNPSDPDTAAVIAAALASPDDYVLKPQREGGGNNLYGAALAARLEEGGEGLAAFVLMQRIKPPVNRWVGMPGIGHVLGCSPSSSIQRRC